MPCSRLKWRSPKTTALQRLLVSKMPIARNEMRQLREPFLCSLVILLRPAKF